MSYDERDNKSLGRDNAEMIADGVVSQSGEVLGGLMKLPGPLAVVVRGFQPYLVGKLADIGEEPVKNFATRVAQRVGAANPEAIGHKFGRGAALVLPYTLNVAGVVTTARRHMEERKELFDALAPLLEANKEAHKSQGGSLAALKGLFDSGYSDNKMVSTALQNVRKNTFTRLTRNAADLLPSFAVNYSTHAEGRLRQAYESEAGRQEIATLEKKVKDADMLRLVSGNVVEGLGLYFEGKRGRNPLAETSLGKVFELHEFIRANDLDSPNSVASSGAVEQVAGAVEDIFQTFQKEQGRRNIPSHRMRDAAHVIANEIVAGDLNSLSLVNIVGQEKLLNANKDGIVSTEKIGAVVKAETKYFSKSSTITSEEFLQNANYTLGDVKTHLQSKDMDERSLTVLLHPDSVLLEAGATKDEIKGMREHLSSRMVEGVATALVEALAKKPDEQLMDAGFTREDLVFIREHNGPGAESITHAMQSRAGVEQVKSIARNALMGEESTTWRDVIAAGRASAKQEDKAVPEKSDGSPPRGAGERLAAQARSLMDRATHPQQMASER